MALCRTTRRFSLKTVLRDATVMMAGTVLGILLSHVFFSEKNDKLDFESLCGVGGGTNSAPRLAKRGGNMLEMISARQYRRMPRPLPAVWGGVVNKPPDEVSSSGYPPGGADNDLNDQPEKTRPDTLTPLYSDIGSADNETSRETSPPQQRPHPPTRNPLLIGIIASRLTTRTAAINKTWGRHQKLIYFISSNKYKGEELPTGSGRHMTALPTNTDNDLRPLSSHAYRALKNLHDRYIDDFDWFVLADDQVYIRTQKLSHLLSRLDPNHEQCFYSKTDFGGQTNIDMERQYHSLGGPGTILSRSLLKRLAPHLDKCLMNVSTTLSEEGSSKDDGVERCLKERTGLKCTRNNELTQQYMSDQLQQDLFNGLHDYPTQQLHQAVMLHPLPRPQLMCRVHQFYIESAISSLKLRTSELVSELEGLSLQLTGS